MIHDTKAHLKYFHTSHMAFEQGESEVLEASVNEYLARSVDQGGGADLVDMSLGELKARAERLNISKSAVKGKGKLAVASMVARTEIAKRCAFTSLPSHVRQPASY
jgi:hypothetical protein